MGCLDVVEPIDNDFMVSVTPDSRCGFGGQSLGAADCCVGHSGSIMVKLLVAGDVKGCIPELLAKVAQYHK